MGRTRSRTLKQKLIYISAGLLLILAGLFVPVGFRMVRTCNTAHASEFHIIRGEIGNFFKEESTTETECISHMSFYESQQRTLKLFVL